MTALNHLYVAIFLNYFETFLSRKGYKMEESYMTIREFCEKLKISPSTVYRMIKSGMIPAVKFGRYWKIPKSVFDRIR